MTIWPRPVPVVGDPTSAAERRAEPSAWRFGDDQRAALYEIIGARRDVRRFRADPLESGLVRRVLAAAHDAPSVGHSQPWRFVLVTEAATRERAAVIAERERLRQAELFSEESDRKVRDLQLEGIREAPLGIVVCCDRRTRAEGVLGRATFPDADVWSCACAIENLWLAARAEGLGLGWVTLFPPDELAALVGLPDGVETLGWLCVGWPDERPPSPSLERAGWSRRVDLDDVVVEERWEGPGPNRPTSHLRAPDQRAVVAARDESDTFLTTPGSLGVLDRALDRIGALGISDLSGATLVVAAADHPVVRHGVSTYAGDVTREVLEATVAGQSLGAAAARAAGLDVVAVDAGVDGDDVLGARSCRPSGRRGDLVDDDALEQDDVARLIGFGRALGETTRAPLVCLGEVGIGNTTIAAALASVLLDLDPNNTVGLGAGGDSATLERKEAIVHRAVSRAEKDWGRAALVRPEVVLGALGGPELAVLTGVVLGVCSRGGVVVLDGFATSLSALLALRTEPAVAAHLVAGQRSRELGHQAVLSELGLEALLDMRLRAGEGVGAVLATQLLSTGLAMRSIVARVASTR